MSDHPLVAVREFREKLHTYTEPVTVIHSRGPVRVLGTWVPDGYAQPKPKKSAKAARTRTDG